LKEEGEPNTRLVNRGRNDTVVCLFFLTVRQVGRRTGGERVYVYVPAGWNKRQNNSNNKKTQQTVEVCKTLIQKTPKKKRKKEKGQDDGVDPLRVFVVRIYSIPYDFVIKVNLLALMSAFECPARGHYKPNLIFQQENEQNYCRIAGALYLYVRHV
jgi:hypothetical protein